MASLLTSVFIFTCIGATVSAEGAIERILGNVRDHLNCDQDFSYDSVESKKGGSYEYKQTFGTEKVHLTFPKKPSTKKQDGLLMASLKQNKIEYVFIAPKPPVAVSSDILFSDILEQSDNDSFSLVDQVTYQMDGNDVMVITVKEKKSKNLSKIKVVTTEENFYFIGAEYPAKSSDSKVEEFLDSFKIL